MLELSPDQIRQKHIQERMLLEDHFNAEMERILNENSSKETYWILGKLKFPTESGGHIGRTFLQACDEKPGLVKDSFLYEVDNKRGVKTLLWVMHPDGTLRFPTLGKTINVQSSHKQSGLIVGKPPTRPSLKWT